MNTYDVQKLAAFVPGGVCIYLYNLHPTAASEKYCTLKKCAPNCTHECKVQNNDLKHHPELLESVQKSIDSYTPEWG